MNNIITFRTPHKKEFLEYCKKEKINKSSYLQGCVKELIES